jgi:hypothetical protein
MRIGATARRTTAPAALPAALTIALLVGIGLLAGCSGREAVHGSGSAGAPGPSTGLAPGTSQLPTGGPPAAASAEPTGSAGTGGSPAEAGVSNAPATHDSTKAPRLPTPGGMQPPTATAAHAVSCAPLAGGGWQATFVVTLEGGQQWSVLPQLGPATPNGDGDWTVVVQQAAGGRVPIVLDRVEVGGGAPFRTAYVVLGPGVEAQTTCPS